MKLPPLGLYIHLPWCERKCPYCDFNSHERAELPEAAYIAALLRDLDEDRHDLQGRAVDTIFIGGGTPSLFSPDAIGSPLRGVAERVPLGATTEITLEANPGSAEAEKFAAFRAADITRLSLGVQSLDDDCLAALGRVHDGDQARAALGYAVDAGFDACNVDLMHGLPGQDATAAARDLDVALQAGIDHLSWYQLTIEPNTVFYKRPPALPLEDALADIQQQGEDLLAQRGYTQYEVSAYSRAGRQCRHNLNYWTFGDYLGIGAGAHGKLTHSDGRIERYAKRRQPQDYLDAAAGEHTSTSSWLREADIPGEFMLNALRLNAGFERALFEQRTGLDFARVREPVEALAQRELLEVRGETIRASALGRRYLDSVVAEFLAP